MRYSAPNRIRLLLVLLLATLSTVADAAPRRRPVRRPIPRTLSITLVPRLTPPPTITDIYAAYDLAIAAGARGNVVTYRWSEIETSPATYSLEAIRGSLGYGAVIRGLEVLLGIQVLNTTAKETPADLLQVPFDSAVMKERFHRLIDAIAPELRTQVKYLSIGNEVDVYLSLHTSEWAAYRDFYADAAAYVRQVAPNVMIGVTATYGGAAGSSASQVVLLNAPSDLVILTYYPLQPDFHPHPPSITRADIRTMVALSAGKPLILQEAGYPTSPVLGGSEAAQALFVDEVFDAWQENAAAIPFLNFWALHDLTPELCAQAAAYVGAGDNLNLREYLCSIGLRNADGTPKSAWETFVRRAAPFGQ